MKLMRTQLLAFASKQSVVRRLDRNVTETSELVRLVRRAANDANLFVGIFLVVFKHLMKVHEPAALRNCRNTRTNGLGN